MDRFGLRRTMLAALALIATGVALTPLMTQPWQLVLLWGVVVGSGTRHHRAGARRDGRRRAGSATRRGLVMGVLTASTATGQLVFLPFLAASRRITAGAPVVARRRRGGGWRMIPIVALLMRDRPADIGLAPYGAEPGNMPAAARTRQPGGDRLARPRATACARAISGCSPAAFSSAAPRPTG